jgi:hypothetical protein
MSFNFEVVQRKRVSVWDNDRGGIKDITLVKEGGDITFIQLCDFIKEVDYLHRGMLCEQDGINLHRARTMITYSIDNYRLVKDSKGDYSIIVDLYLTHEEDPDNPDEFSRILGYYNHYGFDIKLDVEYSFESINNSPNKYLCIDSIHMNDSEIYKKCLIYERKQKINKILGED